MQADIKQTFIDWISSNYGVSVEEAAKNDALYEIWIAAWLTAYNRANTEKLKNV